MLLFGSVCNFWDFSIVTLLNYDALLLPPVHVYELYILEGQIIEIKLLSQSKTKSFVVYNMKVEAQRT